jgi:hypothetical protein
MRRQPLAAAVHLLGHGLVAQVHDELLVAHDVRGGVLELPVGEAVDADHHDRRLLAEHVEHAERRGIDDTALADRS